MQAIFNYASNRIKTFFSYIRRFEVNTRNLLKLIVYIIKEYVDKDEKLSYRHLAPIINDLSYLGLEKVSKEAFNIQVMEYLDDGYSYSSINGIYAFHLYTLTRRLRSGWNQTKHICLFLLIEDGKRVFTIDECFESHIQEYSLTPSSLYYHSDVFYNEYNDEIYSNDGIINNGDFTYIDYRDTYVPNDELVYCVDTDDYRLEEDVHYDDNSGDYYYDEDEIPSLDDECYIREYNAGIPPYFILNGKVVNELDSLNVLSLVLEVEVKFDTTYGKNDFAKDLHNRAMNPYRNNLYKAYTKRDGSISDTYGVEVATSPYCISSAKESFCAIAELLKEYGASGNHKGYGIHIHYNKNLTLSEFYVIALLHDYRNRDNILKFSNRLTRDTGCLHYSQYDNLNQVADYTSDRYNVLNKRNKSYENRMFQSSLRESTIIKNIQYMESMRDYANHLLNIENRDLNDITYLDYDKYLDYVNEHSTKYDGVVKLINDKGIIKQHS